MCINHHIMLLACFLNITYFCCLIFNFNFIELDYIHGYKLLFSTLIICNGRLNFELCLCLNWDSYSPGCLWNGINIIWIFPQSHYFLGPLLWLPKYAVALISLIHHQSKMGLVIQDHGSHMKNQVRLPRGFQQRTYWVKVDLVVYTKVSSQMEEKLP